MSYIAFDLDALNVARDVGEAAGVPEERITHGLLRMWAWCFREKTDTVQAIQVQGFFGASAAPALVAFGFLAKAGTDYRVRGAERYLRVTEQRQNAGKARSSSAGRSAGRFTSETPAKHQRTPAEHQRNTSGAPALTPNTEHLAPNTITTTTAPLFASQPPEPPKADKPPKDSDLLVADFKAITGSDYLWQGAKDGTALAALLKAASLGEVRNRWRRGLSAPTASWASCRTVAELRSKWNHLGEPVRDLTKGVAPVSDWATIGEDGGAF